MADRYFDLSIRLANDAMQSDAAVAAALREIANGLEFSAQDPSGPTPRPFTIRDANGQKVGWWKVGKSRRSRESYR